MTKVCVIGAGPSGLYISKYLLKHGLSVTAYEKEKHPYGHLKCSFYNKYDPKIFNDVLNNDNFKLHLNKEIGKNDLDIKNLESKYDVFVIANGAGDPKEIDLCRFSKNLENSKEKNRKENLSYNDKSYFKEYDGICNDINRIDSKKFQDNSHYFPRRPLQDSKNTQHKIKNKIFGIFSGSVLLSPKRILGNMKNTILKIHNSFLTQKYDNKNVSKILKDNFLCDFTKKLDDKTINRNFIRAIDIARYHNGCEKNKPRIGEKVLIIGCGNVALDTLKILCEKEKNIKSITLLCRKGLENCAFTNFEIRSVFDINGVNIKTNLDRGLLEKLKESKNNKNIQRRAKIFLQKTFGSKCVNFLFNTNLVDINHEKDIFNVLIKTEKNLVNEKYDTVITSIGFNKNELQIPKNFSKPFYYVGWAKNPNGNLDDVRIDAFETANKIYSKYRKNIVKDGTDK